MEVDDHSCAGAGPPSSATTQSATSYPGSATEPHSRQSFQSCF
jgi:hypothetical protein